MAAKASGPLENLAKPWCVKPNPTTSRSAIGAQGATEFPFSQTNDCCLDLPMMKECHSMFEYSLVKSSLMNRITRRKLHANQKQVSSLAQVDYTYGGSFTGVEFYQL